VTDDELSRMAELAAGTQARWAGLHPGYFAAPDAAFVEAAKERLGKAMGRVDAVYIAAQGEGGSLLGFAAANTVIAPPVYAPGGPVGFLRDWHLADERQTIGMGGDLLNEAVRGLEQERDAVLTVVPNAHGDTERELTLGVLGFYVASEWYYRPLEEGGSIAMPKGAFRRAVPEDADAIADLMETKRQEYGGYAPVFWKPAPDGRDVHLPFLRSQIGDRETDTFVAEAPAGSGRPLDGFAIARSGGIDDYAVASPDLWPTVGADLLHAATLAQASRGARRMVVVCGARDVPKRTMLAAEGFTLVEEWWVRDRAE
jgi:hypothetical protein